LSKEISREEMQELARRYKNPVLLIFGSHSAIDAWYGARNYGFKSVIYTTKSRSIIYMQNPIVGLPNEDIEDLPDIVRRDLIVAYDAKDIIKKKNWRTALLILDKYTDIFKYIDDLLELEPLQIPNRAFATYLGGDRYLSKIEREFPIPIVGSRKLLKVENKGVERDYYWFARKAGIPIPKTYEFEVTPTGIRFKEPIDEPLVLKAENPRRKFEREFIFAADSQDLEEKVEKEMEKGNLNQEVLRRATVEQLVLGPQANFNFFFSPLNALSEWGDLDDEFARIHNLSLEEARVCLANELLSIDERRETIFDGIRRLPADVQIKLLKKIVPSFEVTFHAILSVRESLLKEVLRCADAFLLATREYEPPGIIGAWAFQVVITWDRVDKYGLRPTIKMDVSIGTEVKTPESYGLFDTGGKEVYAHIPVMHDIAFRHGGGTNVHIGIGGQYSNAKYNRRMSTGERIALEVRRALKKGKLDLIVT